MWESNLKKIVLKIVKTKSTCNESGTCFKVLLNRAEN